MLAWKSIGFALRGGTRIGIGSTMVGLRYAVWKRAEWMDTTIPFLERLLHLPFPSLPLLLLFYFFPYSCVFRAYRAVYVHDQTRTQCFWGPLSADLSALVNYFFFCPFG